MSIFKNPYVSIVVWITVSVSMILFNKAVLSSFHFPFPMFLTAWHMTFATIVTQILSVTTELLPSVKENKVTNKVLLKQVVPVAILFAVSLILSNKAYIYLSVSYIQMIKAFTPVVVLFLSVLLGLEQSTFIEVNILVIISLGVAICSVGETNFSWMGFIIQALGLVAESARLVLTNLFLKQLKLDSLSTLFYIAPLCAVVIWVACFTFEADTLPWDRLMEFDFLGMLLANAIVAFSLNLALILLISNTSALVLTLAGVVKDILLVVLSMMIFGNPVTLLQYLGYSISLLALNLHKEYKKTWADVLLKANEVYKESEHPNKDDSKSREANDLENSSESTTFLSSTEK